MFSVRELAELWAVSPGTIHKLLNEGELRYVVLGNRRKIPREDAEAYQAKNMVVHNADPAE